jgi:hypothetical protein
MGHPPAELINNWGSVDQLRHKILVAETISNRVTGESETHARLCGDHCICTFAIFTFKIMGRQGASSTMSKTVEHSFVLSTQ